jgi:uncharacterized membrane protein
MPEENMPVKTQDPDVEANKLVAALSYVSILFLVPLLLKKDSKFAQFHAKQGLVLFIVEIVVMFIAWIPMIGWLVGLATLALAIYAIYQTWLGNWWKIPYIYDWSQKFNI